METDSEDGDEVSNPGSPTATIAVVAANQAAQWGFLHDAAPGWTLYQGGWGSGKTWAAARKLTVLHLGNDCPSLAIAPTWDDCWRVLVPALVQAAGELGLRAELRPHGNVQQSFAHLHLGEHPVLIASGAAPSRLAGFEVGAVWLDEAARVRASTVQPLADTPVQARGRLRDHTARVLHGVVSTTPEGTRTWVQRDFFSAPQPQHRCYVGSTLHNRSLPSGYVASLRARLGQGWAQQYLGGTAIDADAGRAHPAFLPMVHVGPVEADAALPLRIGADFNVRPLCWVAGQWDRTAGQLRVLDEYVCDAPSGSSVQLAVQQITARGWHRWGSGVLLHPDRSALNRHPAGPSPYQALCAAAQANGWQVANAVGGANPRVLDRVHLIDRLLCDGAGTAHLRIAPQCTRLIAELNTVALLRRPAASSSAAGWAYDPGSDGQQGHILDALGYLAWDACGGTVHGATASALEQPW